MTGVIGSIYLGAALTYASRRRICRHRDGALRYWLIAHAHCGAIAAVLFLLHVGLRSGGALTTSLMISFDLVILTDLFAIFCY